MFLGCLIRGFSMNVLQKMEVFETIFLLPFIPKTHFYMHHICLQYVYNNFNDYNPNRNRNIVIVFDDMILQTFKP